MPQNLSLDPKECRLNLQCKHVPRALKSMERSQRGRGQKLLIKGENTRKQRLENISVKCRQQKTTYLCLAESIDG